MRPVARSGDQGVPHCSGFTIAQGSSTVFVNSSPAAGLGDLSTPLLFLVEVPQYL